MSIGLIDRQTPDDVNIEEVVLMVMIHGETMVENVFLVFMKHGSSNAHDHTYDVIIIAGVAYKHKCAYIIIISHKTPLIAVLSDILSMTLPLIISKKSISAKMIAKIFVASGFGMNSQ
jgi:hypothetical protein